MALAGERRKEAESEAAEEEKDPTQNVQRGQNATPLPLHLPIAARPSPSPC